MTATFMPRRPVVPLSARSCSSSCATAGSAQPIVGVLGITSEVIAVEQRLQDSREVTVRGHVFQVGTLNGRRVAVGRTGAGKVNAAIVATLLIGQFDPAALFFSGTAGAIDQTLQPGDVVIGTAVAQHDTGMMTAAGIERRGLRNGVTGERDPILLPAPEALLSAARAAAVGLTLAPVRRPPPADGCRGSSKGVIVTGDVFVSAAAQRDELRASLGAAAVEMEGAAVVHACRQFAVPLPGDQEHHRPGRRSGDGQLRTVPARRQRERRGAGRRDDRAAAVDDQRWRPAGRQRRRITDYAAAAEAGAELAPRADAEPKPALASARAAAAQIGRLVERHDPVGAIPRPHDVGGGPAHRRCAAGRR